VIGDRVRHARLYYGWTQEQLASLVGVSQSAIHQIEVKGQISEETLASVAKATGFASWWFELGALPDLPEGTLRYRKYASAPKRDDDRVRAYARHTVEAVERLSRHADLPPLRMSAVARDENIDMDRIETVAIEVRDWLGVGVKDPIPNLVRAVERSGVLVLGIAFELAKHDAVSFWSDFPNGRPFVFFSRGYVGDRQRFSIAHEIGHLVLHQLRNVDNKTAEDEANAFAGALLMPRSAAREEIDEPVTLHGLAYVKAKWGISIRALIRRSLDVGLISPTRRQSLEKQYTTRKWRADGEPVEVREEQPVLVSRLVDVTVGRGTSPTALSKIVGLPTMSSRELVA